MRNRKGPINHSHSNSFSGHFFHHGNHNRPSDHKIAEETQMNF